MAVSQKECLLRALEEAAGAVTAAAASSSSEASSSSTEEALYAFLQAMRVSHHVRAGAACADHACMLTLCGPLAIIPLGCAHHLWAAVQGRGAARPVGAARAAGRGAPAY